MERKVILRGERQKAGQAARAASVTTKLENSQKRFEK
jgi:hypothetical protein